MEKKLLLGDEAIALGAIHAGLSGVYAYPGTPSTEITEFIQNDALAKERGIHSRWCTNEKTAMEAALGMSYAGKRALVCMKHVGMNVCADAFINSAITGVQGGLVVLAADDPSMHSSQNEQDSRFYGKFALIPVFEPSTQQEAYDMMSVAFDYSEAIKEPVMLRVVTRLAHSRAGVVVKEAGQENDINISTDAWVLLPGIARKKYDALLGKQDAMLMASNTSQFNKSEYTDSTDKAAKTGIVACGIGYNYVKEAIAQLPAEKQALYNIEKVSQYPLPEQRIQMLAKESGKLLVVEDGQPVVEESVKGILGTGYIVTGRLTGALPRTGELTPDCVAAALGVEAPQILPQAKNLAGRPPQLCQGCGHRDVYAALNKVAEEYPDHRIFGDIGCYTLGALPPFKALSSCVDMGASITMAKGAADAGLFPAIAVIGDSTFTHSGMTGLLDAVNDKSNITVIISDNLTTGMTGGQDSAGTNKFEAICLGLGVEPEHVRVVVPLPKNMEEITRTIKEEIEYNGVSVIIPRRECIQTAARHAREKAKAKK
ncbi:MAG: thiamine pyrophosphate-dependent enzyme [Prevotellaceae bacterium]|nr:thiamine pyrophosphate-dependent enzyme [Prevotellaceae bacterium]MDY2749108.1 thiamine pyrophosphate-dependent enzyme [Prevotella sp.]